MSRKLAPCDAGRGRLMRIVRAHPMKSRASGVHASGDVASVMKNAPRVCLRAHDGFGANLALARLAGASTCLRCAHRNKYALVGMHRAPSPASTAARTRLWKNGDQ